MTNQHPIIPPPELVQSWYDDKTDYFMDMIRAAQWGADQELEACCEWLEDVDCDDPQETAKRLRAARRPKPPSLVEQALLAIDTAVADDRLSADVANVFRQALEQLPG